MVSDISFEHSYAQLPAHFFAHVQPARPSAPRLVKVNRPLAVELGIDPDDLEGEEGLDLLSGRAVPAAAQAIALAYAGHQFGNFVPQLGDGRAILLGELIDIRGRRRDIQLKGAGRTPFSRGGDGRAALGPVLREYVVSEAMAALGVPTTRALAAVITGDPVIRETVLPGAVLTRVASSHIRVGTFQFFAARGDVEGVRLLADHVIARHYPAAAAAERPYRALLEAVVLAQAELVVRWLLIGFIHGVMNTDNMSVSGETIDYGPCAFLDAYDPGKVFSSIDRQGRYAYGRQPTMAHWDLTRLAETLLPLLDADEDAAIAEAQAALALFAPRFEERYEAGLIAKLGLSPPREGDRALADDVLAAMAENQVDFTLFFRRLSHAPRAPTDDEPLRAMFIDPTVCDAWLARWRGRIDDEQRDDAARQAAMCAVNPAIIPRNHRIEAMIAAAIREDDFGPFEELIAAVARPYEDLPEFAHLTEPPQPDERVRATFCGT